MLLTLITAALAAGPWVPGSGTGYLYVGIDGQRFTELASYGDDGRTVVPIGEGIQSIGIQAAATYGIAPGASVSLSVPFHHGHATRSDAQICADLGERSCDTVNTIGVIEASVKGLILDGYAGAPLSLSIAGHVRYGGFAATVRDRLTGVGEGTIDFGPVIGIGHTGLLGKGGYYVGSLDLGFRYRLPNTNRFPQLEGDLSVPGHELMTDGDLLFAPRPSFAIGPAVAGYVRPQGEDFQSVDKSDFDRFGALRVAEVRVGAKLVLKDQRFNAFSLAVTRTVFAWNTSSDNLGVAAGVSIADLFGHKEGP